ncbi:MAG: hypothetical protein DYG83_08785 [Candidatus Brocadia sp. AMX2]|uniref:CARDB domain-containing protein n=1 Tax=Candidatus Brocadia sinica JPN1 TaxID=1197129 RepID=A0ABQ0K1Z5_9BACT|nr:MULTISPECIES: hypothetical protein [Brocadia]MBC6933422.1 hypothetical protein [Candidatus Brocadia sp.]MBL1167993.1 hypothetical protein [Candidatus Brocadia sp. AMX1]GIK11802.1 MAG: hypothetical protein BroJett002_05090 [Candidatus Brocadia sinica]KAA0243025.1 MAG: hypothetical protein EDM70_11925 [Candidatus Brocadia sp. AMX2]MCE7866909.1 hypothetical protein [Candidatus Brocadia sp. AMX2]
MKYYKKPVTIVFLFVASLLGIGLSYCFAQAESEVHGVAIVSMDVPLSVSIGKKVNIEIVVGNEQKTKVATILTVTCHETGQQIGREALNLDGSSSKKIVYTWNTGGLKEGTYRIHAEVEKIPGETDVDDNVKHLEVALVR